VLTVRIGDQAPSAGLLSDFCLKVGAGPGKIEFWGVARLQSGLRGTEQRGRSAAGSTPQADAVAEFLRFSV